MNATTSEKWEIRQPATGQSFPELDRYTRSDTWQTVMDGEFDSEEGALANIDETQRDPELNGWYATARVGERYVETIVPPVEA